MSEKLSKDLKIINRNSAGKWLKERTERASLKVTEFDFETNKGKPLYVYKDTTCLFHFGKMGWINKICLVDFLLKVN